MEKKKLKVLIAEDDDFTRELIEHLLISEGYLTTAVPNGKIALEKIVSNHSFDLILSDMNMPVMSGLELIKNIRIKGISIPVIILTGNNEISIAIDALKSGASDYLLKDENIQETVTISIDKTWEMHQLKIKNTQLLEELERKNKKLERMAFVDGLTEIPNRRYFNDYIRLEYNRAKRDQTPISLLMIDIDYFKRFNDTYGHQKGDICLKKVGRTLDEAILRSSDFVARYGGEEFAAVLPNTNAEGALNIAQKMKALIDALKIINEKSDVSENLTLSIGVGTVIPDREAKAETLIAKVDKALYKAKEIDRNRIVVAS